MIEKLGIKLYTAQETADLLGVTIQTLRAYVRKGKITPTNVEGAKHFSEEQITDYLRGKSARKQ